MPIVFGIIGITLVISGVRGQTAQLLALVKADFTGSPSYIDWMVGILVVGAIGYIPQLKTISRLFMAIVLIDLLFTNQGFFAQFTRQTEAVPESTTQSSTQTQAPTSLPALPALPTLTQL